MASRSKPVWDPEVTPFGADPHEPIGDFVVCYPRIAASKAGSCREGAILPEE